MSNKIRHVVGFINQSLSFCLSFQFSNSHQVHQFHISGWTAGCHCGDVKTVIAVIDEIGRVQRKTGNSAIVVHGV